MRILILVVLTLSFFLLSSCDQHSEGLVDVEENSGQSQDSSGDSISVLSNSEDGLGEQVGFVIESSGVNIVDENGEPVGYLRESDDGEELLLVHPSGKIIPCCDWGDSIKQKVSSPENQLVAFVYTRNCGATTDWATRLDLVSSEKDVGGSDSNTVFIMKGRPSLVVKWEGPKKLVVQYPRTKEDRLYRQQIRFGEVEIEYIQMNQQAIETEYLEFANFNFGLTGLTAGHNAETLLRIGGWAQGKSGLTRKEWGYWYADAPYGDDPSEQIYIDQGFEYYKLNRDKIEKGVLP
jgi:hypothetical protein